MYAQLETDGYLIVSDDGHVAAHDKEMWATGHAVDKLDDDELIENFNEQRHRLHLPQLEAHQVGNYTRWTADNPSDCLYVIFETEYPSKPKRSEQLD